MWASTWHCQLAAVAERMRMRVAATRGRRREQMWTMDDDVAILVIKTSKSTVQVAKTGFSWVSKVKSVLVLETPGVK
uniref:Uncharacterized protein n=1 Tax=Setaria viridis TaxID=4556 RepID=A0A4U6U3X1_SETVI|nr:hypothetical protein SEVIR_6G063100v2 [Setaria viridis]